MTVIKRKTLVISACFLSILITFIVCVSALTVKASNISGVNGITVVLDAGHGGVDGGVTGIATGVKESDVNLAVVKKLENYFISAGITVVLTRNSEAGLYGTATKGYKKRDMEKRKEIINSCKPTLVISIHMNKYSVSTRRGAQVFFKNGCEQSSRLAQSIQQSFNDMEESVREFSALAGDYYILNCSMYPSIIAECGFLSNPQEESLLLTEEYREKIAYAIFSGTIDYITSTEQ